MKYTDRQLTSGDKLNDIARAQVLRCYIYRFTGDHTPDWVKTARAGGREQPLQFASDADWLAHTFFSVNKNGTLSRKTNYCESYPTWPNNPELRK